MLKLPLFPLHHGCIQGAIIAQNEASSYEVGSIPSFRYWVPERGSQNAYFNAIGFSE
jgi:hypothetical protein